MNLVGWYHMKICQLEASFNKGLQKDMEQDLHHIQALHFNQFLNLKWNLHRDFQIVL